MLKEEAESVQEGTLFTYDDHQSGTAYRDVTPGANRIRAWRTPEATYAIYLNPHGGPPEFELYDRTWDPDQVNNLVDRDSGRAINPADRELLEDACRSQRPKCAAAASCPAGNDRPPPGLTALEFLRLGIGFRHGGQQREAVQSFCGDRGQPDRGGR